MDSKQEYQEESVMRGQRLALLRKRGINPFPAQSSRTHTIAELRELTAGGKKKVAIAGRIRSIRGHGGSTFVHLEDGTGRFQIYLKRDEFAKGAYELFCDAVDVGDFIEATGTVFKTKRGEDTLLASSFVLLDKAVRPFPEKWHGLQDVESRFRKRYLDLLVNEGVRKRMAQRSAIIDSIRTTMKKHDFLEVETPTLQPVYGGGFAKPFKTHHNALGADFYLRISDEMYLKRLLVGGFERVYEITKVFRNEGIDRDHNPEFTMFEAQIAYQDYEYGMDITEEMTEYVVKKIFGKTKIKYQSQELEWKKPWPRLKLVEAITKYTGLTPLAWKSLNQAKKEAEKLGLNEKQ